MRFELNDKNLTISMPGRATLLLIIETQSRLARKSVTDLSGEQIYVDLLEQALKYVYMIKGPQVAQDIYSAYEEFDNKINYPTGSKQQTIAQMHVSVNKILNAVMPDTESFNQYYEALKNSGEVYINSDKIPTTFVINPHTPNKVNETYTREPYIKLLTMSMILRLVHPIWSSIIFNYKNSSANPTVALMSCLSSVCEHPVIGQGEVYEKLINYINFASREYDFSAIENYESVVNSVDMVAYIYATVIVQKAPKFDHRLSHNPDATLIADVYGTAKSITENRVGNVKAKTATGGDNIEDSSALEGYKTHNPISAGNLAIINTFITSYENQKSFLYKKIGPQAAEYALSIKPEVRLKLSQVHSGLAFERAHKILCAMFYGSYVPPMSFEMIKKNVVYEAFSVVLSSLIACDMMEMACLFASSRTHQVCMVGKHSLSEDLNEQIDALYPKHMSEQINKNSPGVQIVHDLYTLLTGYCRRTCIPQSILVEKGLDDIYSPVGNIKDTIAQYILFTMQEPKK